MGKKKQVPAKHPVVTIKAHPWLKGYLPNPCVQWIDGRTVIVWNSPEQKRAMSEIFA